MSTQIFPDSDKPPSDIEGRIPTIRTIPMPADSNSMGDIFGGWLLSQMDLAGAAHAFKCLHQRIVTVGIEAMTFHKPVFIGDEVSFYTDITKIGNTSITVKIDAWALRRSGQGYVKVTEGLFTYVQTDKEGRPASIDPGRKVGFDA